MKLSFHRLVQREVNEAVRWHEECSDGLGEDFFVKLTTVLDNILANPEPGILARIENRTTGEAKSLSLCRPL
jgi:hypothetical protein